MVPPPLPVGFRCGGIRMLSVVSERTLCSGRRVVRLFVVTLTAVTLSACARSPVAINKAASLATSRQTSRAPNRKASFVTNERREVIAKRHTAFETNKHTSGSPDASYGLVSGLASFYAERSKTASGEKFDGHELTAAHRTLPFGTRVRVTNVANGRSVTVRINDRGPFVPGRVVDVSYSAAERLGITDRGITKVKLDVVH
jgi:rare lipoprotein A